MTLKNKENNDVFYLALFTFNPKMIKLLIDSKAVFNLEDESNSLAFMYLIMEGKLNLIKMLLENYWHSGISMIDYYECALNADQKEIADYLKPYANLN